MGWKDWTFRLVLEISLGWGGSCRLKLRHRLSAFPLALVLSWPSRFVCFFSLVPYALLPTGIHLWLSFPRVAYPARFDVKENKICPSSPGSWGSSNIGQKTFLFVFVLQRKITSIHTSNMKTSWNIETYFSKFPYSVLCEYVLHACMLSHFSSAWLFVTLWTEAHQAPFFMGFSRQEFWNGLPCPPPGDLPNPEIELVCLMSPALAVVDILNFPLFIPRSSAACERQNNDPQRCPYSNT